MGSSEAPIPNIEQKTRPEIIASNINAFIAHQDDPAWRRQVGREWFEQLKNMPEVIQREAREAKSEWEYDGGEEGMLKIIREAEANNNPLHTNRYNRDLEIYLRNRKESGEIDLKAVGTEKLEDKCMFPAIHEDPNIMIPFAVFQRGIAQQTERYQTAHPYSPRDITIDNPDLVLAIAPTEIEAFKAKFKQDLAEGIVTGIRHPVERPESGYYGMRYWTFTADEAGNKPLVLTYFESSSQELQGETFFCKPFPADALDKLNKPFNIDINNTALSNHRWSGIKKIAEYLKANDTAFKLSRKGGGIYAYHLIK